MSSIAPRRTARRGMRSPRPVEALIFDLDGTLVDSRADLTLSTNAVRALYDLPPLASAAVGGFVGDGARRLVERALAVDRRRASDEDVEFFRRHYRRHCLDRTRTYAGMRLVLRRFRHKRLAVVTNKPQAPSEIILRGLKLDVFFSTVLGGDALAVRKPDPEPIRHVLAGFGVKPAAAAVVGDGPNDVLAGRAAGCWTVAAGYGFTPRRELKALRPDAWIDAPGDLLRILA